MTSIVDTIVSPGNSSPNTAMQPRPKLIHSPWLMWSLSVCFVIFQFLLQLSAGIMINQVTQSFQLTPLGVGLLASAFYFVYVSLQTPAGMLVDLMGPRRLLAGGGFVCGLGCLLFANSHSFTAAFIGRLLMGGGASFAFVSSLYIAGNWFPASRFAVMLGLAETMGMIGTLIGNVYFASLLQHFSWRNVMWWNAVFAFLIGILCWAVVRDKQHHSKSHDTPKTFKVFRKDVMWIMQHRGLFFNGLYTGLVFSVISVFATLWAIPYLVLVQGVSMPMATFESSLIFVGLAVSCPIMGWVYNHLTDKNSFLAVTAILAASLSSWLIFHTPHSEWLTGTLFIVLGAVCGSYVFNYSLANELVPKHIRTTSVGFTNTFCMITAPILQPFVGWLLQATATHPGVYTVSNYHWALSVIPLSLLLAAAITVAIPKPHIHRKPQQKSSDTPEKKLPSHPLPTEDQALAA